MKFKPVTVMKKYKNELYIFKRGVAVVPGMWHKTTGIPYTITLKEFKELSTLSDVPLPSQ